MVAGWKQKYSGCLLRSRLQMLRGGKKKTNPISSPSFHQAQHCPAGTGKPGGTLGRGHGGRLAAGHGYGAIQGQLHSRRLHQSGGRGPHDTRVSSSKTPTSGTGSNRPCVTVENLLAVDGNDPQGCGEPESASQLRAITPLLSVHSNQ